ncbi:hypothetical protein [Acidipila sp. EB88]|uniref:hypothetical protein n=1 Tax=Acidipila sp. EB88 TaxID=2305226 RepID=UPI000F5EC993|nr:hypothetical protein [Acidipila sp. EB88]RRA47924.1 hypothetical protein D1Y84_06095 [Acidipila sp. EB88]
MATFHTADAPHGEVILLRITRLDEHTRAFAERLTRESGREVMCIVDERNGSVDVSPYRKLSLTARTCRALGIHCPSDFAWRCGDYGLYLARTQYPSITRFWLIEGDVRITGPGLDHFFHVFDNSEDIDCIMGNLQASAGWYWDHSIASAGTTVYTCLFNILRINAAAIDLLLERRRELSLDRVRRLSWANDEAFVATTLSNSPFTCRDLNDFGPTLYTTETLTFHAAFNGSTFQEHQEPMTIYHPVLFGEAYERKRRKLHAIAAGETLSQRARRRAIHLLNALTRSTNF